jgi:hypothetical protein
MALRDDRQDVERLFGALADALEAEDPERLRKPFHVAEIYQRLVPYRTHRARLGIDTNEDYEMAVLRLLAGEGGFAVVHPPEASEMLAAEADAINPDPTLVREYAAAQVALHPQALQQRRRRDATFAPDDGAPAAEPPAAEPAFLFEEEVAADDDAQPDTGGTCVSCGRTLPLHRAVTYCPFCGRPPRERGCLECGDPLESGWRFCATCGAPAHR